MRVDAIMTSPVITVTADADIAAAARLMLDHHISGLPVVDGTGQLVGIISEGDFLRRGEIRTERRRPRWLEFLTSPARLADEYVHAFGRKVGEVMTVEVATAEAAMPMADAAALMARRKVKRLPVVGEGREVIGIVTRTDFLRSVLAGAPAAAAASDAEIEAAVRAELARHPWGGNQLVRASCQDGIVTVEGTIFDERERTAIRVVVENVAGVKGIRDYLATVEPVSGEIVVNPLDRPTDASPSAAA